MSSKFRPGDRILARDRPWHIRVATAVSELHQVVEADALDGDTPSSCSFLVPPEPIATLPPEEVSLDLHSIDSFEAWAIAHLLIGSALVRETGLLAGARFGRVELEAYQLAPTIRLLAKPRPSILIADDVGLGKTVEAGLVLLELMARRRASRVLIVTPPGLMDQWQQEMSDKFGLAFAMIEDAAGLSREQSELPAGINPWDSLPRVLTSLDFLKKESVRARALRKRWDLVIVDEAHALAESGTPRSPYRTQRTRLGAALRDASRGLILLTATPHNGYSHSYRSLLELVEPTMASFKGEPADVERRVEASRVRRLKRHIVRRLLDGSVVPAFPPRHVQGIAVGGLQASERELLAKVSSYCSRTAREAEGSEEAELIGFAMQIVKKRALSSRAALHKTIEHRLEALRKEESREAPLDRSELRDLQADLPLGEARAESAARRILRSAIPLEERRRRSEVRALGAIRRLLRNVPTQDPKVETLVRALHEALDGNDADKVIVFTEYRDTLEALAARLEVEAGLASRSVILSGGLTRAQRLQRQAAFERESIRVLLATDAASEGLNLQKSCRRIIHFELPWNPNRLEQRNGRVDRYGQSREPDIRYLYYPDSAEEKVLDQIVSKMETMQRDRISTPDILGIVAGGELEDGLLHLDPEDADVQAKGESLVRAFDARAAEFGGGVQPLLGIGGGAPEESERIMRLLDAVRPLMVDDTELEATVRRALGPGAVEQISGREGVFRLEVPWAFRGSGVKPLYPAATFSRSVAVRWKAEEVDYITPIHPLIRSLAQEARKRLLQVYASSRGIPPRRIATRLVSKAEPVSAAFTFLASVTGGGGLLEETVLAVRVDREGNIIGDPSSASRLIESAEPPGDVSMETTLRLFSGCFPAMRERACAEAARWLEARTGELRARRHEQAELLLRDLAVDMTDRLREIEEEENRARSRVDEVGQQELFVEQGARVDGFNARRSAVSAYAEKRREEIASYRVVAADGLPRPMGALLLVPRGPGT